MMNVQRFVKQLQAAHPEAILKFCYEDPRWLPGTAADLNYQLVPQL